MTTAANVPTIKEDRILILDFGSQYSQLIARRVRDSGVFCEMFPYDIDTQRIIDFGAKGVILSGGPESVHADDSPRINDAVFGSRRTSIGYLLRYASDGRALRW